MSTQNEDTKAKRIVKPYVKKIIILKVLELLWLSAENKLPMTYSQMREILLYSSDIEADKKTIKRNVKMLKDYGFDIVIEKDTCYLNSRTMPESFQKLNNVIKDFKKSLKSKKK